MIVVLEGAGAGCTVVVVTELVELK